MLAVLDVAPTSQLGEAVLPSRLGKAAPSLQQQRQCHPLSWGASAVLAGGETAVSSLLLGRRGKQRCQDGVWMGASGGSVLASLSAERHRCWQRRALRLCLRYVHRSWAAFRPQGGRGTVGASCAACQRALRRKVRVRFTLGASSVLRTRKGTLRHVDDNLRTLRRVTA